MRISLNDIAQIEAYLEGKLTPQAGLFFHAKMLISPDLAAKTRFQKRLYDIVRMFGRKQLKKELEEIHHELLNHPEKKAFREELNHPF